MENRVRSFITAQNFRFGFPLNDTLKLSDLQTLRFLKFSSLIKPLVLEELPTNRDLIYTYVKFICAYFLILISVRKISKLWTLSGKKKVVEILYSMTIKEPMVLLSVNKGKVIRKSLLNLPFISHFVTEATLGLCIEKRRLKIQCSHL